MGDVRREDPRLPWLLSRVDHRLLDTLQDLLEFVAENLSMAIADGVAVRALSEDGQSLIPVLVRHFDPDLAESTSTVPAAVQPSGAGMWSSVMATRAPRRWVIAPGSLPVDANDAQRELLSRLPVRAVLAAPLMVEDRLVGGISVVRVVHDRPFDEVDEELVVACARRLAPTLDLQRTVTRLALPVAGSGRHRW